MRVGKPEVERDGRRLDEETGEDQDEGGQDQRVRASVVRVCVEPCADLREAEFAGVCVQQTDAEQCGVAAQ